MWTLDSSDEWSKGEKNSAQQLGVTHRKFVRQVGIIPPGGLPSNLSRFGCRKINPHCQWFNRWFNHVKAQLYVGHVPSGND
jgi:hypothetical protein